MIRNLFLIGAFLLLAGQAAAQKSNLDTARDLFSVTFVQSLEAGSEADCRSRLESRKLLYQSKDAGALEPLRLIVEGHRLICERLRIESEVARLRSERSRLLTEVERLNALWRSSGAEDFAGRDRSQQIMLADVSGLEKTEERLNVVAADLRGEAIRILRLSVSDIERHTPQEKEVMRVAIDAEAQKSIFDGFRELLPKVT